jgi:type VI secretion system protein
MAISSLKTSGQKEANMTTLFEVLTQSSMTQSTTNQRLTNSILWHLSQLLNTRQGTLQHLPDYGLPDICEIYRRLPQSVNDLLQEIVTTIEKYEPRIKYTRVTEYKTNDENHILNIKIFTETTTGSMDFNTYFGSNGYVEIKTENR